MMKKIDLKKAEAAFFDGELGAIYDPQKTLFRFWQPFAQKAFLRLYNAENELLSNEEMTRRGSVFELEKHGDFEGFLYDFEVVDEDGRREFADPYARSVKLEGTRAMVVDMRKNAPDGWENDDFSFGKSIENAIIYELSVRDFSVDESANFASRGKFLAFCEKNVKNKYGGAAGLEYIKSLGITHIQLMPVFDFDFDGEEYNWGYNPRFFNAPCDCYAVYNAVSELRELIFAAHKNNIGVVADMVYNHVFSAESSCFEKQFPGYFFRGEKDFSNGSGCGNEFASERLMARKFIIDSVTFLAKEYHLDGFRFDLMGLLDIQTMLAIEQKLRAINPSILLYGEGWTGGASPLPETLRAVQSNAERLPGYAFFNDSFRDAVKGSVFDKTNAGFVNGATDDYHCKPIFAAITSVYPENFWAKFSTQTINYVECHDNHTLFDKLRITLNNADPERILQAEKMSAALIFLSCGPVFLAAGEEFLRSKNFVENSYNSPDSVNSLKWDLSSENRELVEFYRGLISLRKRFYGIFEGAVFSQKNGIFTLKNNEFILIINTTNNIFYSDFYGNFEIYINQNSVSEEPICREKQLCCAENSVLLARRIINEK